MTLSNEATKQLRLHYELAASAARGYLEAGFSVVYQDIIVGESLPQAVRPFSLSVVGHHILALAKDRIGD